MPIDRIDSYFNIPAIDAEFAAIKSGLAESQTNLVGLYSVIKSFKDTSLSNLAQNTENLTTAINGTVQATARAKTSYDELTQKIAAQVKTVNESITSINQNNAAYDKLIQQAVRNKIANDDLAASAAALKKSYDSGAATLDQYTSALADIKAAQQTLKTSNQDVTKSLNAIEKQAQSSSGSLDQLRARLNELTTSYDKLNLSERESEGGQGLLRTIQATDQAVKSMEGTTGRFRGNVGNYSGALTTLEKELADVNAQLAQMDKMAKASGVQNIGAIGFKTASQRQQEGLTDQAGPTNLAGGIGFDPARYKDLTQQAAALNLVLSQQEKGFTSVTQQIRSSERALASLEAAGLEGSKGFEELRESTVSASQAQKEFLREEKLLESEVPVLGALTLAAKGLAGAYAIGAGATALFSDGNEKVEKELSKLVAIMTILQGLQEAWELIQKAGAISEAVRLALRKATNVVLGENAARTAAVTEANLAAAAAADAAAAATGEEAVAMQAEAVAAGEAAAATEAAAAASVEAEAAFVATGIGVAIAAVAVAVVYLISRIKEWMASSELNVKQQKELNEVLVEQAETIKAIYELYEKRPDTQGELKALRDRLDLEQKSGQNQYVILAAKEAIAQKEKEIAEFEAANPIADAEARYADQGLKGIAALKKAAQDYYETQEEAQRRVAAFEQQLAIDKAKPSDKAKKGETEQDQDILDKAKSDLALAKANFEATTGYYTKIEDADKQLADFRTDNAKMTADELRRLALETANLEVEEIKNRNSRILAMESSTLPERLAAIKSNAQAEIKAARAEYANVQNDPATTGTQLLIARKELNSKILKANQEAGEQTVDMNRKYYERDRDAALAATRAKLEDQIKLAQDLQKGVNQNNPNPLQAAQPVSMDKRLQGLSDEYAARRDLLNAELKVELDKEGLTAEEKTAIYAKYTSNITQLNKDFQKSYLEIEAEARQKSLDDWNKYYDRRKQQIDENAADEIKALNQTGEQGKNYLRDRQKIEDEAALARAHAAVQDAEVQRNATKEGTKERIDSEKKLSDSSLQLSDALRKQKEDSQKATRDQAIEYTQEIQTVGDAALSLEQIGYNTQKQHMADLEKRQELSYERQAKNIQDSTASQEQMAIRMKILDDQRAQQKLIQGRKEAQLEIQKAEFDKAKAIMDIILGTAVSVVKALDNPLEAIAIGIAGAAELAIASATPIPKMPAYRHGTEDHPGGRAIVGDAYESELIVEPGKAPRWSAAVPTVESLMKHTKVIPRARIEQMALSGMFVNQQGILVQNQEDNKKELRDLKEAIIWQTQRLESAAGKTRHRTVIYNRIDTNWGAYLNKNVFDKK